MATLLSLVEEALLISEKLNLLKQEELGQFISDEVIAERIIQLKSDNDADPACCPNLKKVTEVLFQSAQAYKKLITPEQAKEAIKKLQPGFNIGFKEYVECDFMLNTSDFIVDLRIKGFQNVIQQMSRDYLELSQDFSAQLLEIQKIKEENRKLKQLSLSPAEKAPTTQIAQALFGKRNPAATPEEINAPNPKREDRRRMSVPS